MKNNKTELKKYIETVYNLESAVYETKERISVVKKYIQKLDNEISNYKNELNKINNKKVKASNEKDITREYNKYKDEYRSKLYQEKLLKKKLIIYPLLFPLILVGLVLADVFIGMVTTPFLAAIGILPVMGVLVFLIFGYIEIPKDYGECKRFVSYYIIKSTEYEDKIENEKKRYEKDYQELVRYKERMNREIPQKQENIKRKKEKIEAVVHDMEGFGGILRELNYLLDEIYAENIIHAKYRNLHAISYFYDYLDTGRCEDLKECMNKYDDDMHFEKIYRSIVDAGNKISAKISKLEQKVDINNYILQQGFNKLEATIAESNVSCREMVSSIGKSVDTLVENQDAYNSKMLSLQTNTIHDINEIKNFEYIKYLTSNN